jgi:hypothetical protein
MDIQDRITEYCQKIASVQKRPAMVSAENGRRFTRIVQDNGTQRFVHAFVDMTNGDVIKAAGWKAPQRGVNGLAVRFNLLDDASRENAYAKMDPHGGYLYEGVL